jgi:hypothetical protein
MPPGENSRLLPGRLPPAWAGGAIDAALPPKTGGLHREGPGDMLAVALRHTVPLQQGHVVGCQAAFTRPHHCDPFFLLSRLR